MKTCTVCLQTKELTEFHRNTRSLDQRCCRCRICSEAYKRAWRVANPSKSKAHQERYVSKNEEKVKASKRAYFEANTDKAIRAVRKWQAENPAARNASTARRYAAKTKSTPAWAKPWSIQLFYLLARHLTETTGVPHHVDHIVPLRSKWVCGLHVEHNLRVIEAAENVKKNNIFKPGVDGLVN